MLRERKFWIGLGLSVLLLYLSMQGVDWEKVWLSLRQARWAWLPPALFCYVLGYWSRARRVSQILAPIKRVPSSRCLPPLVIGFLFNNILPGRVGEFVFAWLLGKREQISRTAALAVVVISRILDGFTILAFFLFGLFSFLHIGGDGGELLEVAGMRFTRDELVGKVYLAGILSLLIFALVFVTCFALILWKEFTFAVVERILAVFPARFSDFGKIALEKFIAGLDILRQPQALLRIFFFNFVPWGLELLTYWLMARTFGLDLNLRQCALVMGMTNLAMIVPSGPGGIGLFEGGGLICLALYGVEKAVGVAYIVMVHAVILLPIDIWGIWYFWRQRLSFKQAIEERFNPVSS